MVAGRLSFLIMERCVEDEERPRVVADAPPASRERGVEAEGQEASEQAVGKKKGGCGTRKNKGVCFACGGAPLPPLSLSLFAIPFYF